MQPLFECKKILLQNLKIIKTYLFQLRNLMFYVKEILYINWIYQELLKLHTHFANLNRLKVQNLIYNFYFSYFCNRKK